MDILKVLVVDDEPGIRGGVSRVLRGFTVDYPFMDEGIGFEITEASTGEEAIELLKSVLPDIVLLDNKLPGIYGVEVLNLIKKNYPSILVIMITSYASLDLAVKATKEGAYDFVPKPFTPQELKASMESVTKHIFLRKMTKTLKKEGKEVRFKFLSVLSHELKSPLNSIEGYLNIMKEKQAGENIQDYMGMIDRSLSRVSGMRNLIMDLLDLTKLDADKSIRERNQVDLVKIANSAMDLMMPYAIQKDLDMQVDSLDEMFYNADAEEMEIVLNNLISNAVKYNKQGGKVICKIENLNNQIILKIIDTGIGISEEDQGKLFGEFSRIRNDSTKYIAGTGLGLSIVKTITDRYDGRIEVHSSLEDGSEFIVYLPLDKNN